MNWKTALYPWLTVILILLVETMWHKYSKENQRPEKALNIYAYFMITQSLAAVLVCLAKVRIMTKCRSASNWVAITVANIVAPNTFLFSCFPEQSASMYSIGLGIIKYFCQFTTWQNCYK